MTKSHREYKKFRKLVVKLKAWRSYKPGARPLTQREDRAYFRLASIYG